MKKFAKSSSRDEMKMKQTYTTHITPDDVLFGRGASTFRHPGNVKFLRMVKTRKAEYLASSRHEPKQTIAQEIIDEIIGSNGRFLREVKTSAEACELGIPRGTQAWVLVGEAEINAKVKQALREGECKIQTGTQDETVQDSSEPETLKPSGSQSFYEQSRTVLPFAQPGGNAPQQSSSLTSLSTALPFAMQPGLAALLSRSRSIPQSNLHDHLMLTRTTPAESAAMNDRNPSLVAIPSLYQLGQQIPIPPNQLQILMGNMPTQIQQPPIGQESIMALLSERQPGYVNSLTPAQTLGVSQTQILQEQQLLMSSLIHQIRNDSTDFQRFGGAQQPTTLDRAEIKTEDQRHNLRLPRAMGGTQVNQQSIYNSTMYRQTVAPDYPDSGGVFSSDVARASTSTGIYRDELPGHTSDDRKRKSLGNKGGDDDDKKQKAMRRK